MKTSAILLEGPKKIGLAELRLIDPGEADVVVEVHHSGISTGTERLFWSGDMPPFPGMGYPLVPGYEAVGEVVEAARSSGMKAGDRVFVPGASCYQDAHGLFGGSARRIVSDARRITKIPSSLGADATLMALAATARHAIASPGATLPELIIGHGVLGRLLARLTIAAGAPPPMVWEVNPVRRSGADGYEVIHPDMDARKDYGAVYDASGHADHLDHWVSHLRKGGELVLAGFYSAPLSFAFPSAFLRELRLRVSAEWTPSDMDATRTLVESGSLSLAGLITHERAASDAANAYQTAFTDPSCLKMILDWSRI